jgi:hypothetical protein
MTTSNTSLFKPADSIVRPWVKCALDGFPGSGKSTTAALITAGVHKAFGVNGPIYILDNERSSKFLLALFAKEGVKAEVVESDSLDVMAEAIREVESVGGILLIDSLTNISERLVRDYLSTLPTPRKKMEMQDHPIVNAAWRTSFEFPFVLANCHIVFTGRATNEWANEEQTDELSGEKKRGFYLKGQKMMGQKDTLYAPDFVLYMERQERLGVSGKKKVWREATVIKDRSRVLDGRTLRNPTWKSLAPMFKFLQSMPAGQPNTIEGEPLDLFGPDANRYAYYKRRDVAIEELDGILSNALPGQTAKEKKARSECLMAVFGTYSKTKIEGMQPERLEDALPQVRDWLRAFAQSLNPAANPNGGAESAELVA